MATIYDRITEHAISATAEPADRNPNMEEDGKYPMDHWRVTLRRAGRKMTVYFSMGQAHNGKAPKAAEVLNCLALDSAGIENAGDFDGWCRGYGYDTDSRKAHRTYAACQRQAQRLRQFIGSDEAYQALLFDTESL